MTEFIIVLPVLLLLTLGALQFTFIYNVKTVLTYATFQAARAGALNNADPNEMAYALAGHLAAIYTSRANAQAQREARACVIQEINQGMLDLEILNPTAGDFGESYATKIDTYDAIPNDNLMYRETTGGTPIQEANLLKIRVTYCHRMIVPFVNRSILSLLTLAPTSSGTRNDQMDLMSGVGGPAAIGTPTNFRRTCLVTHNRLPISAEATIRMQSPAILVTDPINLWTPTTITCNRTL
ncbi:MAG: TadE/TadG family type IV pilus assembly protein [Pseudomonadota bacterium]